VIDLEAIVTKVDKSLKAVKQSLKDPNQRIQKIEDEISGLSLQIKHIREDVAHAQHTIKNLESNQVTSTSPSEAYKPSEDFLSGKIEISDEGIKFAESLIAGKRTIVLLYLLSLFSSPSPFSSSTFSNQKILNLKMKLSHNKLKFHPFFKRILIIHLQHTIQENLYKMQ
jgi:chromosome segregation ATPase